MGLSRLDRRKNRKQQLKKSAIIGLSIVLVAFIIFGVSVYNILNGMDLFSNSRLANWLNFGTHGSMNLLLLGVDVEETGYGRSDTIIVARVDFDRGHLGLLSVPRDTRVVIPGHSGYDKINAAFAYGGGDLASRTVAEFLDLPIDAYIATDFSGFEELIDLLGGVTIRVDRHMHYEDEAGDLYIDIPPGRHRFDGEEALHYVRYRDESLGDIGRISRQQEFLQAALDEILDLRTVPKLPQLIERLMGSIRTNMTPQEMVRFAQIVADLENIDIETQLLRGRAQYIDGINYWIHDPVETNVLVDDLLRSGEYFKNREVTVNVYNGNGIPGMAQDIATELRRRGFVIGEVANADSFDYQQSRVILNNREQRDAAERLAQAFGVRFDREYCDELTTDIDIIVGMDLKQRN